jgi:hypothetical protein
MRDDILFGERDTDRLMSVVAALKRQALAA